MFYRHASARWFFWICLALELVYEFTYHKPSPVIQRVTLLDWQLRDWLHGIFPDCGRLMIGVIARTLLFIALLLAAVLVRAVYRLIRNSYGGNKMGLKDWDYRKIVPLWAVVLAVLLSFSAFHVFSTGTLIVIWIVICGNAAIATWRWLLGREGKA